MNSLARVTTTALPAVIGLGVAWFGMRFIKREEKLIARKMELEIQLGAKSLKGF